MGASSWSYFTPYQADVEAALQKLRQEIFDKKEFGQARMFDANQFGDLPAEARQKIIVLGKQMGELEADQMEAGTIEEALEIAAESGTHSILDIIKTSPVQDFGVAFPAAEEIIGELYGSVTPSRADLEAKQGEITELMDLERWQAVYFKVYENGEPVQWYFEGVSGD